MNGFLKNGTILAGLALAVCAPALAETDVMRVSEPGRYEGYSPVLYDGWELSSQYVSVRDGTRLAVDVIRPTLDGEVVTDPLPVVWMHTPYNRRRRDGESAAITYPSGPIDLVQHGYVVAVADFRGLYGSFGQNQLYNFGSLHGAARTDSYDITEWLAAQPWSSGAIGMWGCSATGGSQQRAASEAPPSLRAIFPLSPGFDAFEFVHMGGVTTPIPYVPPSQEQRDSAASPVDGPEGEALLQQAFAQQVIEQVDLQLGIPFRDSASSELGMWWHDSSFYPYLGNIEQAGIAVYAGANWDEAGTKASALLMFGNVAEDRRKLIIGPDQHCRWPSETTEDGFPIQVEQLRFFDYWLKGIDNGIMDEPPVTYYTYNAPAGEQWRQSETWPLAEEVRTVFYLGDGVMGASAADEGSVSMSMAGEPHVSPVMLVPDSDGLTFDTAPLESDMEVTGYPVVDLWLASDLTDADVTAQLLDVAPDGTTRSYQMVGRLRASRRVQGQAPYDNFGLPYHTQLQADESPLVPGEPVQLQFALMPMSYIFPAGHRIRLALSVSNPDEEGGEATFLLGGARASSITLPLIPGAD